MRQEKKRVNALAYLSLFIFQFLFPRLKSKNGRQISIKAFND